MAATALKRRLDDAAGAAHAAEARRDDRAASETWRRYRLIRHASCNPDQLLVEGVLSATRRLHWRRSIAARPRPPLA